MTQELKNRNALLNTLLVAACALFASCVSTKNATYFNNVNNDTAVQRIAGTFEPAIQQNDILQITVSSLNPQEAMLYNLPNSASSGATAVSGAAPGAGFLVDAAGNIQYPVFGSVHAAGLSTQSLADTIRRRFVDRQLLVDPVVNVRFLNFRVTLLGEVSKPAVITVTSEKISIMEALGMAGDITVYGKRDNVMLIRDKEGARTVKRLNLNDASILSSPYYYLQPNDIVYVEPTKSKVAQADRSRQILPVVLSGLSLLVIILDRLVIK
ncbi:polysaccharide biosynthesis/export family protein [Chitinophaga sp.]|uniref:polysaccharide biosynthesis/export family protein n=1 Tax=Chitinophaga sp. TaxID=1869181 RepID=UPI002629B9AE|nr:polysaccharide biosynthesis/export family protein [uncultured Chitinophaga sp.]